MSQWTYSCSACHVSGITPDLGDAVIKDDARTEISADEFQTLCFFAHGCKLKGRGIVTYKRFWDCRIRGHEARTTASRRDSAMVIDGCKIQVCTHCSGLFGVREE